ncbi:MAG: LysR family transcriptional regulator [Burkholderiaceae bacterium]
MKSVSDRTVFIAIVDEGSLTRAADRLGLSLAVCSKRLLTLENRLGVRLLNRTTRQQHLTDAGSLYYEHCLRIQEDIDAVESSLAGLRDSIQGTLRVTTSASFGRKHVSPVVPEFLKQHPGIKLQLIMTDNVLDMVAEGIDVGIRIGALADSSLIAIKLAPNRRVLCASPAYLQRAGTPLSPDQLGEHDCLVLSSRSASHDVWTFETSRGVVRVPVSSVVASNSGEVVRDAAIGGLGIGIKSIWDITEELRKGDLVTVLDDYPLAHMDIFAVYHNRRYVAPKVRAWIDFFKTRFGSPPYWEAGLAPADQ